MKYRSNRMAPMIAIGIVATASMIIAGCEREESAGDTVAKSVAEESTAVLPDALFVKQAPEGARSIAEARSDTGTTGKVVVKGRIGGREKLFVSGAAIFVLADMSMKTCTELHPGKCPTPWDYCCEAPESLGAKVATVQIVGKDGRPLRVDVQGREGLDPLATIVVSGEIAPGSNKDALVINAEHIYVEPKGS